MKKNHTIVFILAFFSLLLSLPLPSRAEDSNTPGCCQFKGPDLKTVYQNLAQKQCDPLPSRQFWANYHVNATNDGCEPTELDNVGALAPKTTPSEPLATPLLSVLIPDLTLRPSTCDSESCTSPWLGDYIGGLYKYGIAAVSIIAAIALMIAGIIWISSAGNSEQIGQAKKWIKGSLMGLLLIYSPYVLLSLINGGLVRLAPIRTAYIKQEPLTDMTLDEVTANDVSSGTIQSKGQECYFNAFGNDLSTVQNQLVTVNMFGKNIQVHQKAKAAFETVNRELQGKTSYNFYSLGTWNWRANVNNPGKMSLHSFGIAIDINPEHNPNGNPCRWDLPQVVIDTFKNNGFRWGGNYKKTCDTMHFEWLGPCQQ